MSRSGPGLFDAEEMPDPDKVALSPQQIEAVVTHYKQRLDEASQSIKELVPNLQALIHNHPKQPVRILSIGCGANPIELIAFRDFLRKNNITSAIRYFGCDIDSKAIDVCQQNNSKPDCSFHAVDCTNYKTLWETVLNKEPADIVVLRHPVLNFYDRHAKHFHTILTQTAPYLLRDGGGIFVSIYTEPEKYTCRHVLSAISLDGKGYAELPEDQNAPSVKSETRTSTTGPYGHLEGVTLKAEQFFFVIPDFHLSWIMQRERARALHISTESAAELPVISDEIVAQLVTIMNDAPIKMLPVDCSKRRNYILTRLSEQCLSTGHVDINALKSDLEKYKSISSNDHYKEFVSTYQNQNLKGQPSKSPETELQKLQELQAKDASLDEDDQALKAALELCIHNQRTLVQQLLQHFLEIYQSPLKASEKQMLMRQASRLLATRPLPLSAATSSEPRPTPFSKFDF